MNYDEKTFFVKVKEVVEKKENAVIYFALNCEEEIKAELLPGDILEVETESGLDFFAAVRSIEESTLNLYISRGYEVDLIGLTTLRLSFSPRRMIKGADEIMAITELFPTAHYEQIRSYGRSGDQASLMIDLANSFQKILKLDIEGIVSGDFTGFAKENEIQQMSFRNQGDSIEIQIEAIQGLQGKIQCQEVQASWIKPVVKRSRK